MKNAKKLFALLLTMAMVMSLFSGIVLAADDTLDNLKATISASSLKYGVKGTLTVVVEDTDKGPIQQVSVKVPAGLVVSDTNADHTATGTTADKKALTATAVAAGQTVLFSFSEPVADRVTATIKVTPELPVDADQAEAGYVKAGFTVKADDGAAGGEVTATVTVTDTAIVPVGSFTVSLGTTKFVANKNVPTTVTVKKNGIVSTSQMRWELMYHDGGDWVIESWGTGTKDEAGRFEAVINIEDASNDYVLKVTALNGDDKGLYGVYYLVNVQQSFDWDLTLYNDGAITLGDHLRLEGKLVKDDKAYAKQYIRIVDSIGDEVARTRTAADGTFVVTANFEMAGLYEVQVSVDGAAWTPTNQFIKVNGLNDLSISVTTDSNTPLVSEESANKRFKVTVYDNDSNTLAKGDNFVLTMEDPDGKTLTLGSLNADFDGTEYSKNGYKFQWVSGSFLITKTSDWKAGEYKFTAKQNLRNVDKDADPVVYYYDHEATKTVNVATANKVNVFTFLNGATSSLYPKTPANPQTLTINIQDGKGVAFGAGSCEITRVRFAVTGPLQEEINYDSRTTNNRSLSYAVNVEQGGTIRVKGVATLKDGSEYTFEKTLTVTGFLVTTERLIGSSGDEVVLKATVTKTDGTPVNNARVTWESVNGRNVFKKKNSDGTFAVAKTSIAVDGTSSAYNYIVNGVYTTTVKLADADDIIVKVERSRDTSSTAWYGSLYGAVNAEVLGQSVYTTTIDKTNVIAGLKQTIKVSTVDADGKAVKPTAIKFKSVDASINALDITDGKWSNNAYEFTILPTEAKNFTVITSTTDGQKIGKLEVPVVAPSINAGDNKVTDRVKEEVTVKLTDEISGGGYVRLSVLGGTANIFVTSSDVATKQLVSEGDVYEFNTKATSVTFKVLAADDIDNETDAPELIVDVGYSKDNSDKPVYIEAGRIAVTPATIEADKAEIAGGIATPVKVTLKDAHGNPMSKATIEATGVASTTGITDDSGETVLTLNAVSTGNVKFTVIKPGLSEANVSKMIKAVADTTAPEITINDLGTVKTDTVTLTGTVKDNIKVTEVYVNGVKVLFVPGPEATIRAKVALEVGVNEIEIYAFDAAGNASTKIVTVIRELPTVVKMTLGTTDVTKDGQALTGLDVPAQSIGGRTMLPLRFAFETLFGGTVDYNNGVITVVYNGKTATMTVGSTAAFVDGEAITLLSAPVVQNGRTLAPIREVLEKFGVAVGFDSATNSVTLTY